MGFRRLRRLSIGLGAAGALAASTLATGGAPVAAAQPCPDAEIIFARGTDDAPGVGVTGQAFVDAVRSHLPGRNIGVYAVNYPASGDFGNPAVFPSSMFAGAADAGARVRSMAANCPNTKLLLGGFSQGAAVAAYVTTSDIPPEVHDRVAGVVLFGKPTAAMLSAVGAPAADISPLYAGKSLDLCAPGDSVCDGSPGSLLASLAHALYPLNGLVGSAAASAAGRLA